LFGIPLSKPVPPVFLLTGLTVRPVFKSHYFRFGEFLVPEFPVASAGFLKSLLLLFNKNRKDMYPAEIVVPMKEELTDNGFTELLTTDEVEAQMAKEGTTLVVINSVCGCSAGSARPGVLMAVANAEKKPDYLTTSFAGFDIEAVKQIREHLMPFPPSSPAIALFKNGKLVHFIERHQIEGRPAQMIAQNLIGAFDQYCN